MRLSSSLRSALILTFSGCLASCGGKTSKIPTPDYSGVDVYEKRLFGAGPAPDSVKVYITDKGSALSEEISPVFEGQDVGLICYHWIGTNLNISISGGYADQTVHRWFGTHGHKVNINYRGKTSCN